MFMIAARSAVVVAAVAAVLAVSGCSSEEPDGAAASETTSVAPQSTSEQPTSDQPTSDQPTSDQPTSEQPPSGPAQPEQEIVIVPTAPAPEEASDLFPWNQPRPSLDSGNVDPALFATDLGRYNFTTPSGNIQCGIWAGGSPAGQVGCQAKTSVAPFEGRTCTNAENDKYAVRVNDGGTQHICTTQGIYTADEPRVLEYGQVLSAVGVVCESDEMFGITCWGTEGAFMFARDWNESWS
ncbi:hypothetical protein CH263_16430 [Rhodococcus sp. 06-1059B-a]|nr:hypothetical protein CH263_16430 [Rhodococcus sp. 06-1059B-a]